MQQTDIRATIQSYRQALEARDLARCVAFYTEDATIHFGMGLYQGKEAIEEWHRERFAANLQLVRLREIQIEQDKAILDVLVSSDRLKLWRINTLHAMATILFKGRRIKEVRFAARVSSPFEAW
jgi:hypothetical protein